MARVESAHKAAEERLNGLLKLKEATMIKMQEAHDMHCGQMETFQKVVCGLCRQAAIADVICAIYLLRF